MNGNFKTVYLAGGCFWGTEMVFKSLHGVVNTSVGYANGNPEIVNPSYKLVCTNTTGYKETVKVVYNPEIISLDVILEAYFLCIDPTLKNRQGNDIGTQYQTGVYAEDEEVLENARKYFEEEKKKYPVFYTELEPLTVYYDAEEYHQNYLAKNPGGYCHITKHEMEQVRELDRKNRTEEE
ncbi:MAG: peptide-methionine (S)-S-oxide reductase MsrA [Erysipelotrichales bacterium]|nr:peptide-methionine (S)-S-oxide reductase MsrA [Erysipelotrichales bacterium]